MLPTRQGDDPSSMITKERQQEKLCTIGLGRDSGIEHPTHKERLRTKEHSLVKAMMNHEA